MKAMTTPAVVDLAATCALGEVHFIQRTWDEAIDMCSLPGHHWAELALRPMCGARARFVGQVETDFTPMGQLFLYPAGYAVHTKSEVRDQTSIACGLDPEAVGRWLDMDGLWPIERLTNGLDIGDPRIRTTFLRLGNELRHPGFAHDVLIEHLAGQIAIDIVRYCRGVDEPKASGGLAPWRLCIIEDRIRADAACPTLGELAALCQLSVRQMTRGFRASRGRSIGDYIEEVRMRRAKTMLVDGCSIQDTAFRLDFHSLSSFYLAFRRSAGMTPRQYREDVARR